MNFGEQVEALCVDRQEQFRQALLSGKPLRPRKGEWTLGDVIFLTGTLNGMLDNLRSFSEDEFKTPLSEIFTDFPA